MVKRIGFYKVQASGNDFILIDQRRKKKVSKRWYVGFTQRVCCRKVGVGADGVLVIESSKRADFVMRIFNADGSEAEMCGNGARCCAYWYFRTQDVRPKIKNEVVFETKAGMMRAQVQSKKDFGLVRLRMSDPVGVKRGVGIKVLGHQLHVDFLNTGVPHVVVFVQGIDGIDVETIGRAIRQHKRFQPAGTNVNFVECGPKSDIRIRTYERGVEKETLACGTGSVASAIAAGLRDVDKRAKTRTVRVKVQGDEELTVAFDIVDNMIKNVWLTGQAYIVYEAVLHDIKI